MDKVKFPYWLAVEESSTVRFADLAHLMAIAMHPGDDEPMSYGAARINLDNELKMAVRNGNLCVRNPAGMGRHTFPVGDALNRAVLMPADLRPFLEERGIELRLLPHGSGPTFWTIENAAAAVAAQEGWSDYQRATFQDQMVDAASNRNLTVRHPHTDLPKNTGPIRTFYELVTPADVNTWLEKQSAHYRWTPASEPVTPIAMPTWPPAAEAPASKPQAAPPSGPGWTLNKPKRYQGYGKPLYDVLKAAHAAGLPRPTAIDVLDAFAKNRPLGILGVTHDSMDYQNGNGIKVTADLDAIRAAIGRLTRIADDSPE